MFYIWLILVAILIIYLAGPVLSLIAAVLLGAAWYAVKLIYTLIQKGYGDKNE